MQLLKTFVNIGVIIYVDIRINLIGIPSVPELFDGFKFLICLLTSSSVIGLKKKRIRNTGN